METLGKAFSSVEPTFADVPTSAAVLEAAARHGVSDSFLTELRMILTKPAHLKLRAKFVDVIVRHLPAQFFETPPMIALPVAEVDDQGQITRLVRWESRPAPWFMKREQLERSLKAIYDTRSAFVHEAKVWPQTSKFGQGYDLVSPPVPTFFWFERVVSVVLVAVIREFRPEGAAPV